MVHALATPRRVRKNRPRWRKTASGRQHYNYFRDYDPSTGRYVQSDPIGLAGGLSAFSYVGSNPLSFIDSLGLKREWTNLGLGYRGGIDTFNVGGSASYEIHVFDRTGKEVGMYGPDGWFNKHGKIGRPDGIPLEVETQCNGRAVDIERRLGIHPPQGAPNSKGHRWRRVGRVAGAAGAAAAVGENTHRDVCAEGDPFGDGGSMCSLGQ